MKQSVDKYFELLRLYVNDQSSSSKKQHALYAQFHECFKELRDHGDLKYLVDQLDQCEDRELVWVATHLLVYDEKLGISILNKLAHGDSMASFSAEMTLTEYNKGNLTSLTE